ncbi:NADP-dependent oxidoreductase [Solicola sp. PLA-1-18]|uniref:NADP-dependent oxidoreductase n=1 Tax=Solicola sp. PLA-1-18 TaxID=3380532 RepID=UPI003B7B8BFA
MKAVRYHEYGDAEVLRVEDAPEPHAPAGAVRIRTQAVSVNPIDWKLRAGHGRESMPLTFPVVPGRDAVGVVDEVGDGVEGVAVGDLVFGLGGIQDVYAEHAVLTAWATPPDAWDAPQAAAAGLAVATALRALAAVGPVDGRTVLVEGASGAVGSAVAAFTVDRGARVIGTARPADHPFLADLGVVPTEYGDGLAGRVADLAPEGVDLAIDTAGAGSLDDLVQIAGGPDHVVTVTDFAGAARLGVVLASAENDSTLLEAAAELGARGGYTPRVARVLPLARAAEAHRLAEAGGTGGKIVLTVD